MSLLELVLGKPLATTDERAEHIGPIAGIPVFGLDALSSAAYGPEAALTLLIPLGVAGIAHIVPISFAIIGLLIIVFFSYRQTIDAYPHGGGSYTVATENLGPTAGLFAAAALMIDYILNAAVGISAGVGALVSAFPSLQPHTLAICLLILAVLTLVNMRGTKDAGAAFMVPTYLFIGSLLVTIGVGACKTWLAHGHPTAVIAPPHIVAVSSTLSLWLLLKVFASGCTAMTGVEAVSNGVNAFREPTQPNAKRTLTIIIVLLAVFLGGIALLCRAYNIMATDPTGPGYDSILSQLIHATIGGGWFYYLAIGSILAVLALSANTSFADFPRLTRAISEHDFLPHVFQVRGRRLLYSHGIYALVGFTALLLITFGGVTDKLILSSPSGPSSPSPSPRPGMVVHWYKQPGSHSSGSPKRGLWRFGVNWHRIAINGIGAIATGITLLVVLVAKFLDGAWITALLIPALILLMMAIKRHYVSVEQDLAIDRPIDVTNLAHPLVVFPSTAGTASPKSPSASPSNSPTSSRPSTSTPKTAAPSSPSSGSATSSSPCPNPTTPASPPTSAPSPELIFLESPYRFILLPLVQHIRRLEQDHPDRQIAVLVPELVVKRWWQTPLHNQRAQVLKLLLLLRGNQRIMVINIPWYL